VPAPASCGDCGRYVAVRAKKIIADGSATLRARTPSTRLSEQPDPPTPTTRTWPSPPKFSSTTKPVPTAVPPKRTTARRVTLTTMPRPEDQGPGKKPRMATSPALEKKPTRYPLPKIPKTRSKTRLALTPAWNPSPGRTRPRRRASPARRASPTARSWPWARALFFSRLVSTWPGGPFGASFPE
jgi:hypothetical protein